MCGTVPSTMTGKYEVVGRGERPLSYRELILMEYHNGALAGHQGRDRTTEMIERDFWWSGLPEDVRRWCRKCIHCQGERGTSGVTAWTRTELYSRPFRVLQYDTITCRKGPSDGAQYVLTVICCFSRYCWLIPIKERSAETIAQALLERVFLGEATFPLVLESDNAQEFVGAVMEEINRLLAIRHVTGSAYHPQSQGDR